MKSQTFKNKKITGEISPKFISHNHGGQITQINEKDCNFRVYGRVFDCLINCEHQILKEFDTFQNAKSYLDLLIIRYPVSEFILSEINFTKILHYV